MTRNKVEICGVDTSKLPVLTNAEMRELFRHCKQDDDCAAREKLVNGNLRLVLSVIQRFNNRGEYVDDLFQVGCIGLDEGDRQFRSEPKRQVFHLCGPDDYRGNPPLSSGQ